MGKQFFRPIISPISIKPAIQTVKITSIPLQPMVNKVDPPQPKIIAPIKAIVFQNVFLSKALFNINKNGPVITKDEDAFYKDRFDSNKKWYFPEFKLQQPLQNSFLFTCYITGPDTNGDPVYGGEANFTLQKNVPAEVINQRQNNPTLSFNEIPLNNLYFNFSVTLGGGNGTTSFPCTFVQNVDSLLLTIKLDEQTGLIRFYKIISNPDYIDNCSLKISASYFCYSLKPSQIKIQDLRNVFMLNHINKFQTTNRAKGIDVSLIKRRLPFRRVSRTDGVVEPDKTENYITNDAMPFNKNINSINFDCHAYPENYLVKDQDNIIIPFAGNPPFGDGSLARPEFIKIHITNDSLAETGVSTIYKNVYNGNYLVIPQQYKIALDEIYGNLHIPAAYLFTNIDASGIENSNSTFKFNIAPDISGFQLLQLKKILLKNIPKSLNKTLDDIFIIFPEKIHQPELIQFNKDLIPNIEITEMGIYEHGTEACNYFKLEFQNVKIGGAISAQIALMLKKPQGGMFETISFDIDSDTDANPQSSILLSLNNITGNGLHIQQIAEDNSVYLMNKTLYTISVSALADKKDAAKILNPEVAIDPNKSVTTTAISDHTEIPFTEFNYKYSPVQDYVENILNEIRTDAGKDVHDVITITNNTGLFSLFNIDQIDLLLSIINPDTSEALYNTNVISLNSEKDGALTSIDFFLPVNTYLNKWAIVYSTEIHFTDSTVQANEPEIIEDINNIGKVINLTVTNLHLND